MLAPSLAASLDSLAIRPSCEEFKRLTTAARVTVEVAESRLVPPGSRHSSHWTVAAGVECVGRAEGIPGNEWQRIWDSNPCYRRERAAS